MFERLIDFSLKNRLLVVLLFVITRRGWRLDPGTPAGRRLPRHHPGAGADQHHRPGPRAGGDRDAADHAGGAGRLRPAAPGQRPLDLQVRPVAGGGHLRATTCRSTTRASSVMERLASRGTAGRDRAP
ncbi:MAG: hypothetical protein MZW92_00925 [Comamonadaceae bacterium]|nr:hypothetical protein [Comamonadaceae bacterium]